MIVCDSISHLNFLSKRKIKEHTRDAIPRLVFSPSTKSKTLVKLEEKKRPFPFKVAWMFVCVCV